MVVGPETAVPLTEATLSAPSWEAVSAPAPVSTLPVTVLGTASSVMLLVSGAAVGVVSVMATRRVSEPVWLVTSFTVRAKSVQQVGATRVGQHVAL